ncbi:MAG: hypothetical protein KC636_04375, partial [Myxococcales bacterium]|nr:hypothetical protein [Myxococcales bacterium]
MTPDWEALRRASASIIEVHGRRATPPHRSVGFYEAFRDALTTCCGSWCSAGQLPGDESARGWCWCHSPWKGWEGPTRPAIERAVASVVDEVRACLQWHRQMAAVIEASAAPGEDPDALALLIVALVDQIVALGIHDAWYPSIAPVVAWALERHGV